MQLSLIDLMIHFSFTACFIRYKFITSGIARDWTIYKRIEDMDMKGTAINFIQLHPRERRLLVHTRDNIIRMFDLRM